MSYNNTGNWSGANVPDTTAENAIFVAAQRVPRLNFTTSIGCFDLQSGSANAQTAGITLTIAGDYFKNPVAGSLSVTAGTTFTITLAGAAAQTFTNQDPINYLTISNPTSVTFDKGFNIRNDLTLSGSGTTLYVNDDLTLENTGAVFTIPATTTVEVANGAILKALGGITVNGTLKIMPGSAVILGNGKTLTVNSGGMLQMEGASGNISTMDGDGNSSYSVNVAGSVSLAYFRINHLTAAGINLTGTLQAMNNGEFHYLAANGYAMTLGAGSQNLPATMDNVGFFNDSGAASVRNFNATSYTGTNTTLTNWAGLGGDANENGDGGGRINWGSQAPVKLTLSNNTAAGNPPTTITVPGGPLGPFLFTTFAFALTDTATATDVTSVKITLNGTASSSDIDYLQVFRDNGTTACAWDASDSQIGSNTTLSGSPSSATISIPAGQVTTSGNTPACIHVRAAVKSTAQDDRTIAFQIASTADVINSQSYTFSDASGPPISGGYARTAGVSSFWDGVGGAPATAWGSGNNWRPNTVPSSTRDCRIGLGGNVIILTQNGVCQNAELQSTGTVDFNSSAWEIQSYANLSVASGHTFTNVAAGGLAMVGAGIQSLTISQTFPGNLRIANTGAAGSDIVNVDGSSSIGGAVSVNSGVLKINSGITLTVTGNVTVASGATLEIAPGGTLTLGDGATLTVNSGGTLKMVGTSSQDAQVTSTSAAARYAVVINGTIHAQYYTFSRMGTVGANQGVTINSGATIDSTYHLQNGSFIYPVSSSSRMLSLNQQVPTNTMDNMTFDANGSGATSVTNVYTNAAAGTLTITTYTGNLAGAAYDDDISGGPYAITWTGATNTIDLTQESVLNPPTTNVSQGTTYTMGRYGFKQTQAGAAYSNTSITSLKLTLTGTATSSDISQARIYYDSACSGSGGTLLGSGTFSGNPATVTFSGLSGAVVEADVASPPKRCIYVVFDISASATNANTVGVKIAASSDVVNDQAYEISSSTPPPVTLGSAATIVGSTTVWTGAVSTSWSTAGNWNGGVPTSSLNCQINSATNNPTIAAGATGICKSLTIGTGTLTLGSAASILELHGSLSNTGTITWNGGTLRIADTAGTNQTLSTTGNSFPSISVTKTNGGTVRPLGSSVTIAAFTMNSASGTSDWQVTNGQTQSFTNGVILTKGYFSVQSGGTVAISGSKSVVVNGGYFRIQGTNDAYPQTTSNKGTVTVSGAGTWGFSATSGTVDLTGFILDSIDTSGLVIGGTTTLANLNGGQFTGLSTSYASVKAIQLNTTGSIPATATNVGWNWGAANSPPNDPPNAPAPDAAQSYLLASSTGCGNQSIAFDQWFGDFFANMGSPVTSSKVSATNCTITIAASASPVSILSFEAAGYDAAVLVKWRTGSELDHAGFNVLRSTRPDAGFIQVNPKLIRNFNTSAFGRGNYRYVDSDVENGKTYYYKLEDIATNGDRTRRGPVSATPMLGAGSVPPADADSNGGSSSSGAGAGNSPTPGTIANGGLIDLGNGIHVLARTRSSMRIEIVPPLPAYAPSSWNASYETVSVPGYSSTLEAGMPELAERVILIDTEAPSSQVTVSASAIQEASIESHRIAPAASWALDAGTGTLVPTRSPDAAAYGTDAYSPASFVEVAGATQLVGSRNTLQLKIKPLLYNPLQEKVRRAARIVLDIGLGASAWAPAPAPTGAASLSPALIEGTLRIRYAQTGMHQLDYDDLVSAGVDGPFQGAAASSLRLYQNGSEIPVEVLSATGTFSSGDAIRFHGSFQPPLEDRENEVVLSRIPLAGSTGPALRISTLPADPSSQLANTEEGSRLHARAEQDLYPMFDGPHGASYDGNDHFYWGKIYAENGQPLTAAATLVLPIELPGLIQNASEPVRLRLSVKGGTGYALNGGHHLSIYANGVPYSAAEAVFQGTAERTLEFDIPASFFVSGSNQLKIQVNPDQVVPGDWDVVYINRAEIDYLAQRRASQGLAELSNTQVGKSLTAGGFTDPVTLMVYDVTSADQIRRLDGFTVSSPDGGLTHSVTFATSDGGASGELGRRFVALESSRLLKPVSLTLGRGAPAALRSNGLGADLLIVGPIELIVAAQELMRAREAQGLRVVAAPIDQVYAEFSHGLKSSAAIRDLVSHASSQWQAPAPKYLLILGDATYDPRDSLGQGTYSSTMPIPLEQGLYLDFGADNWFVEQGAADSLPALAVGRIPTNRPDELAGFIAKLLDYESSARAPQGSASKALSFVSDRDQMGEEFAHHSDALAASAVSSNRAFSASRVDRTALGADAAARSAILNAFEQGPLALTYLGHGAEDRWADASVFTVQDAESLENSRLPIVLALNCLNSYFYDADPGYPSLGERLLLNPSGGAIAFLGSTTMTQPGAQISLARAFFDQLGQETRLSYHDARIGDLLVRAKHSLQSNASTRDALRSYTLFGDPSMVLPASAFAPATAAPVTTVSGDNEGGGGFLSCGLVEAARRGGGGGSGSGPGSGAAAEMAVLMMALAGIRALLNRKSVSRGNS